MPLVHFIIFGTASHDTELQFCLLYGCETWSLTSREERRLSVFENGVLRMICERKWNEVTGGVEKTT